MRASHLKTNYLENPIGIDCKPTFMWQDEDGKVQTAYQIIASSDGNELWDSGKVNSSSMSNIPFPLELTSSQKVIWKVRVWDENEKEGPWSECASFEMGLLKPTDWKAEWISGNYTVDKKKRYPVDYFSHQLTMQKEAISARLYISACGIYEATIDNNKIGNFCLAPGVTDYRKRVQYQTYDCTDALKQGTHELAISLADGWYRGSTGAWGLRNQYGTVTAGIAQLQVIYADHSIDTICTDGNWQWSNDGPITFADNKDGEIVDANKVPTYQNKCKVVQKQIALTASNNVPVNEHEHFTPSKTISPNGATLFDFRQNIAGYLDIHVNAKKGQKLWLQCGEMLDEQGNLTLKNIQCTRKEFATPLQKVEYTCQEGENHYHTKFAVFGFRYVEVRSDVSISPKEITAIAVYSDIKQTGYFQSSNELLNKFFEATVWSTKNNSLDIPTDCPTRERHGWTGDAQIFFETASYLFDYTSFSKKYLRDVYDWQKKNEKLPQIAPDGGVDSYMKWMDGCVGWADAGILIPYRFWKHYGDEEIIHEYYDRMVRYANFMISRCGKWGGPLAKPIAGIPSDLKKYIVNCGQGYGEWAEPADVHAMHWTDCAAPHPEVSTAYTAYVIGLMEEIANQLGKAQDAAHFHKYAIGCRKAYQALVDTEAFTLDTDRQAQLVRPLSFHLLNKTQTEYAKKRLIEALEHYQWRLGTGFLSTPLILDALASYDLDATYRLLENEQMPGWLFMSKNGTTTIWEAWEGTEAQGGIASLDHYSKGAVCAWVMKTMCGIQPAGENKFIIAPKIGGHFTSASGRYDSIYETVQVRWTKENDKIKYYVEIPCNTSARLQLPNQEEKKLEAGVYTFEG